MKTELPQDSPVCFHDFSVADESIAWSSCSSAGLASSSIHGAKLTLSLESTSFRLHNVALRFGIYNDFDIDNIRKTEFPVDGPAYWGHLWELRRKRTDSLACIGNSLPALDLGNLEK